MEMGGLMSESEGDGSGQAGSAATVAFYANCVPSFLRFGIGGDTGSSITQLTALPYLEVMYEHPICINKNRSTIE